MILPVPGSQRRWRLPLHALEKGIEPELVSDRIAELRGEKIEALDSERVLIIGTLWAKFRATGIRDEIPMAQVVTLANRRITRVESYYTREDALEVAGLREQAATLVLACRLD